MTRVRKGTAVVQTSEDASLAKEGVMETEPARHTEGMLRTKTTALYTGWFVVGNKIIVESNFHVPNLCHRMDRVPFRERKTPWEKTGLG